MARKLRALLADVPVHVVQRGNDRLPCFFSAPDHDFYLRQLRDLSELFECSVHAYVLMTNHVHLLATPATRNGVSLLMKHLGQRHAQFINRFHKRTGALWEGRFYSCLVEPGSHLFRCSRYIEMNPVRAGMVKHPSEYAWSSYLVNAEGAGSDLIKPHPSFTRLANSDDERRETYRNFFNLVLDANSTDQIRTATKGGFALGSEEFRKRMEMQTGRRLEPGRPGPKKSGSDPELEFGV